MRVLVVDDEKNIRESVKRYLKTENIETVTAENGLSAKREQGPCLPVIMISAYGEIRDAVEAMKLGAQDYIIKPFDPEELVVRLKKIVENQKLLDQIHLGRDAERRKVGMFEVASGGTLFLDEIGEMSAQLQVKLLRVLQDRKVQRLGATDLIPVDARIIAATNQDLQGQVRENSFREDLYYRLNVIHLVVPPFRDRIDDLPLLAGQLMRKLNYKLGKSMQGIDPEGLRQLKSYSLSRKRP